MGDGADWYWSTDPGFGSSAGTGVSIVVDPALSTTYYVRAEGDCNTTASVSQLVTVQTSSTDPTGISVTNDNTCEGTSKTLTVIGGSLGDGADWYWSADPAFGSSAGTGVSIVVDPAVSTTYYVRAEGDCNTTASVSQLVTVKIPSEAPTMAYVDSSEFCVGAVDSITLSYMEGILGTGAEAYWYDDSLFTGPAIAAGNHVAIPAPTDTITYFVRFEGDCNITEAVSVQVVVNPLPVPVIEGMMTVCEPVQLDYTVSGFEGSTFNWSVTGGNIIGQATSPTVTVEWIGEGAGSLEVSETSMSGCVAAADSTVIKHATPPADSIRTVSTLVCSGDTGIAYYVNGLENSAFDWMVEGGIISREFGDSIIVDWTVIPGDYMVTFQETSEFGCTGDLLSIQVQVAGPDLDLGEDSYVCEGGIYEVTPAGEFSSYLWHDGSTEEEYTTSEEGWISLEVTDEYGCKESDSLYLTVYPLPMVDLGNDTSLCGDVGLVLDAGTDGDFYTWSTGDNSQQITIYMGERREIWVEVEDENGCTNSDTIVIKECIPEFYFRDIPTAITPNDDGVNDVWNIEKLATFTEAVVEIFNRWGTLVWRSEPGYPQPWDGRDMRGNLVPMDSYHFVILLHVGSTDRVTGIITVIR